MTIEEILKTIRMRFAELKMEEEREYKELLETVSLAGESCYAAGYSRGTLSAINNEFHFLELLIDVMGGNER